MSMQLFEPYFKSFIEIVQNIAVPPLGESSELPKRRYMIMTTRPGKKNYIFLSHCFHIFNSQINANKFIIYLVRVEDLPQCHLELVESWPV